MKSEFWGKKLDKLILDMQKHGTYDQEIIEHLQQTIDRLKPVEDKTKETKHEE